MTHTNTKLLTSQTPKVHFILVLSIGLFICSFLYILGVPLIYWFAFGEGEVSARVGSQPFNIFVGNWGALITVLIIGGIGVIKNLRTKDFSHAKSYIISGLIIIGLYIFRSKIEEFLIGIFQ